MPDEEWPGTPHRDRVPHTVQFNFTGYPTPLVTTTAWTCMDYWPTRTLPIMSRTPTSPVDNLPPALKDQTLRMYRQGHEAQLLNLQQIQTRLDQQSTALDQEEETCLAELEECQKQLEEIHKRKLELGDQSEETKKKVRLVEELLQNLNSDIPDGMIADPVTGLSLRIKEICGLESIDDREYVSVIFEESDECNRWVALEYIMEDSVSAAMFEKWSKLYEQYRIRFPNGPPLARVEEFKAALDDGTHTDKIRETLYPVYQPIENGPKHHFKRIVNCTQPADIIYATVYTLDERRISIPVHALSKCDLASALWNFWYTHYMEAVQWADTIDPEKDYDVQGLKAISMKTFLPESLQNSPAPKTPSPKKRKRRRRT